MTCPVMTAGSKYEFQWCDGVKFKKPVKMSAPEYVDHLMTWVQKHIDDEQVFPTKVGVGFSTGFVDQVKTLFKRMFRVYAHIYHSHYPQMTALGVEAHLNTSFKHFMYFCAEFRLMEEKDMAPLHQLVAQMMTQ
jgi:MOB kinase activator 1